MKINNNVDPLQFFCNLNVLKYCPETTLLAHQASKE